MDQVVKADALIRNVGLKEMVIRQAAVDLDDEALGQGRRAADDRGSKLGTARAKSQQGLAAGARTERPRLGHYFGTAEARQRRAAHSLSRSRTFQLLRWRRRCGGDRRQSLFSFDAHPPGAHWRRLPMDSFLGVRGMISASDGELSLNGIEEVNLELGRAQLRTRQGRQPGDHPERRDPHGQRPRQLRGPGGSRRPGPCNARCTCTERFASHTAWRQGQGRADRRRRDRADRLREISASSRAVQPDDPMRAPPRSSARRASPATPLVSSLRPFLTQMPADVLRAFWPPFIVGKGAPVVRHQRQGWIARAGNSASCSPAGKHRPRAVAARCSPNRRSSERCPSENASFTPVKTFPLIEKSGGGITFGNATASFWAQTGIVKVAGKGRARGRRHDTDHPRAWP